MEIYCDSSVAESIISISKSFNVDAQVVGRVESGEGKRLTLTSEFGVFEY